MQRSVELMRRPLWMCCLGVCLAGSQGLGEQDDSSSEDSSGNDVGEPETRYEPWLYISIPGFGIVTLQEALQEGSQANLALEAVGQPIGQYEPVSLHAPTPSVNNGALMLLMLPERCLGDFNDDGRVDFDDLPLFLDAFLREDPAADLSGDGQIDLRDQVLFVALATMPCFSAW